MTRADFENRFNSLFDKDNPPSMDVVAQFRQDVLSDYDNATAATTTITTLQTQITTLTDENTNLRNTNYKLFQMNPAAFQFNNGTQKQQQEQHEEQPTDPVMSLSDIQKALFE